MYNDYFDEIALAHHGILGQKWGIRRFQNPDGSLTEEGRKRYSKSFENAHEDYKKAHRGKSVKTMSDTELKAVNNRLQMERQYRDLSSTELNDARKTFNKAMKVAGTVAVATTTGLTIYNNLDKIGKIVKR